VPEPTPTPTPVQPTTPVTPTTPTNTNDSSNLSQNDSNCFPGNLLACNLAYGFFDLETCTCLYETGNCFQGNIDACNYHLGQFDPETCTCEYPPRNCEQSDIDLCAEKRGFYDFINCKCNIPGEEDFKQTAKISRTLSETEKAQKLVDDMDYFTQVFNYYYLLPLASLAVGIWDFRKLRNGWANDESAKQYHWFSISYAIMGYWTLNFLLRMTYNTSPLVQQTFRFVTQFSWVVGITMLQTFIKMKSVNGFFFLEDLWNEMFLHYMISWACMMNYRPDLLSYDSVRKLEADKVAEEARAAAEAANSLAL